MRNRILIYVLILMVSYCALAEKSNACFSSAPSDNLQTLKEKNNFVRDFNNAQAIFTGKVIAIDDYKVKFSLDQIWKGNLTEEFIMSTGKIRYENKVAMTSSCDYEFRAGKSYLVFAYKLPPQYYKNAPVFNIKRLSEEEHLLVTFMYHRTKPLEEAEQGIKNLNRIEKPGKIKKQLN